MLYPVCVLYVQSKFRTGIEMTVFKCTESFQATDSILHSKKT